METVGSSTNGVKKDGQPTIDFVKGQGVQEQEIQLWKKAMRRLDIDDTQNPDRIQLDVLPTPIETIQFFEGEFNYKAGKFNRVNNPLQLIRPATLQAFHSMFYDDNGDQNTAHRHYEGDQSKRKYDDRVSERNYVKAVRAFEEVATIVLESLNEPDSEQRKNRVKRALGKVFDPKKEGNDSSSFDIRRVSPAENPQAWLVYCVLSILNNPSDNITPVGRLRALELLQIYSISELVVGFRSEKYNDKYHTGYDRAHIPRLPHTFCPINEWIRKDHRDIWRQNSNIEKLILKSGETIGGETIDCLATAAAIIVHKPEEAVQIALLFLHDSDLIKAGLAILRTIPELDQLTLSRMFGAEATFLIEHELAQGMGR